MISFGLIIFILGALPYLAVHKVPDIYDWNSRFQLLLPLGFSFILYYSIQIMSYLFNIKKSLQYFFLTLFIFLFIINHLKDSIYYNIDWFYQVSIMHQFKNSKTIQKNNTFLVNVELNRKLAKRRTLRSYELNGMSRRVFGTDNKSLFSQQR